MSELSRVKKWQKVNFFGLLFVGLLLGVSSCKTHRSKVRGERMQDFVIELSAYAKSKSPNFIIIPQNGPELFFDQVNADAALNQQFLAAVDGIGVEELFYNGDLMVDDYRLAMLQQIAAFKKVMVADYLNNDASFNDAWFRAENESFIAFPRVSANYDYKLIPSTVHNENALDVTTLQQAQNYLYLISTNGFATKTDFLTAIQQTNFDAIIIDAFWGDSWLSAAEVESLKTKANGGKRLVIAYMSIGSAENYRYYWKDNWKLHRPNWLKKTYDGYPDEFWVKYWKKEWKNIIFGNDDAYTDHIIHQGFDGAYLDNVEAYYFLVYDE